MEANDKAHAGSASYLLVFYPDSDTDTLNMTCMKQEPLAIYKDTTFRLKENRLVRLIFGPYCAFKRRLQTVNYINSDLSRDIAGWKGRYDKRRCFIIGNGSSLVAEDLEKLKGEKTFASNRIFKIYTETDWRPDFYVAFEPEFCIENAGTISKTEVREARFINMAAYDASLVQDNTYWLNCTSRYLLEKLTTRNIEFSMDISKIVNDAYSVTFTMLQIAFFMGFNEIYLLGMDHYDKGSSGDKAHFYVPGKGEYHTPTYLEGIEYGYRVAESLAKKHGIRIMNATRGGKLEVFERVNLDSLFNA